MEHASIKHTICPTTLHNTQFAQYETSIGTTPLTEMTIDTGTSEPVSHKPYPIEIKHYKWVQDEINKLLMEKVI